MSVLLRQCLSPNLQRIVNRLSEVRAPVLNCTTCCVHVISENKISTGFRTHANLLQSEIFKQESERKTTPEKAQKSSPKFSTRENVNKCWTYRTVAETLIEHAVWAYFWWIVNDVNNSRQCCNVFDLWFFGRWMMSFVGIFVVSMFVIFIVYRLQSKSVNLKSLCTPSCSLRWTWMKSNVIIKW